MLLLLLHLLLLYYYCLYDKHTPFRSTAVPAMCGLEILYVHVFADHCEPGRSQKLVPARCGGAPSIQCMIRHQLMIPSNALQLNAETVTYDVAKLDTHSAGKVTTNCYVVFSR